MLDRLRLSLDDVWAFLAVGLPVLAALLAPMSTVDLAYQVRAGQLMLDSGAIVRSDPFTFTAGGAPWLDQQWGAQLILALGYGAAGWAGLAVLRAALVGLVFGLVFAASRLAGAPTRVAALLTLLGFLVSVATLAFRAQLLGMVCFALALVLVAGRERWRRSLWLVPLVILAWANVHGSFVLGPALVGAALLDDLLAHRPRVRETTTVLVASLVATALTPFGPSVWGYALSLSMDPQIRQLVTEWQPTSPLSFVGATFFGSVVLAAVTVVVLARRRLPRLVSPWLLWLLGLAVLGAVAQRGIAWWALGAPVVVAGLLARAPEAVRGPTVTSTPRPSRRGSDRRSRPLSGRSLVNGALVLVLTLAGFVLLPSWREGDPLYGPTGLLVDAPRGVTDALRAAATPTDRLFAAQSWGSWFELVLPGVPVFADSRIEVVPAAAWSDYLAISGAEAGWSDRLDRWKVTLVAASKADQPALIAALDGNPRWRRLHVDDEGAVFIRRGVTP